MMEKLLNSQDKNNLIKKNIEKIFENVDKTCSKIGKKFEDIIIVGVTKTVDSDSINTAIACGIKHIGENKVQEYLQKKDILNLKNITTHFIGTLQTNKVKKIVGQVDMIQSVNSIKLADEISKTSLALDITTNVLLEVNIGKEQSKSGLFKEELMLVLNSISQMKNIKVKGLMTIPPFCESKFESRKYFNRIFDIFVDITDQKLDNIDMQYLSMGMSADYNEAILEGANIIRPGTAIFGSRI
jgi:pyridoxal phosphate enzyme, YggS family